MSDTASATATPGPSGANADVPTRIYLIPYPKVIYLYPAYLVSIAAAITMLFAEPGSATGHFVAGSFLAIFATNLVVISFDFPRTTSLTLFFFFVAMGIGLWALFKFNPTLFPAVAEVVAKLKPEANSTFFFCLVTLMSLIYIGVFIAARFDYWEVRPNELLHHHGFLSNLKRFAAPNLRIEKEITDVFEYMLLRSGRLILQSSSEPRPIVIENVINIDRKEAAITRMLSALTVRVQTGDGES